MNNAQAMMTALCAIDPVMARVMDQYLNSVCTGKGKVGSNGSTECNETMMSGRLGEHVCFNHFPKPADFGQSTNGKPNFGDLIYQAAADKSNGVPVPKKTRKTRLKGKWSGVNGKQTGGIV